MEPSLKHQRALIALLLQIAKENNISFQIIEKETCIYDLIDIFENRKTPTLLQFLQICNCIGVNFFFESKNSTSINNDTFERAMTAMGRREDNLTKN